MTDATPTGAIILAAGKGTRLRPLTLTTPKALVEVAGQSLVARHLHRLAAVGVQRVVVNVHHLADQVRAAVGNGSEFNLEVVYSYEEELLETGGGITKALPLLGEHGERPFLCLSADVWTELSLAQLGRPLPAGCHGRLPVVRSHLGADFGFADTASPGRSQPLVPNAKERFTFASVSLLHPDFFAGQTARHFPLRDLLFPAIEQGPAPWRAVHRWLVQHRQCGGSSGCAHVCGRGRGFLTARQARDRDRSAALQAR